MEWCGIVLIVVVIVAALLLVGLGVGLRAALARHAAARQNEIMAEHVIGAIARLDFHTVEFIEKLSDPTPLQRSFLRILSVVRHLRQFVPDRLLNELADDELEDSDQHDFGPKLMTAVGSFGEAVEHLDGVVSASSMGGDAMISASLTGPIEGVGQLRTKTLSMMRRAVSDSGIISAAERTTTVRKIPSFQHASSSVRLAGMFIRSFKKDAPSGKHARVSSSNANRKSSSGSMGSSVIGEMAHSVSVQGGPELVLVKSVRPLEQRRVVVLFFRLHMPTSLLDDINAMSALFTLVLKRIAPIFRDRKGIIEKVDSTGILVQWGGKGPVGTAPALACTAALHAMHTWTMLQDVFPPDEMWPSPTADLPVRSPQNPLASPLAAPESGSGLSGQLGAASTSLKASIGIACGRSTMGAINADGASTFLLLGRVVRRAQLLAEAALQHKPTGCVMVDEAVKASIDFTHAVRPSSIHHESVPAQSVAENVHDKYSVWYELVAERPPAAEDEWMYQIQSGGLGEDKVSSLFRKAVVALNHACHAEGLTLPPAVSTSGTQSPRVLPSALSLTGLKGRSSSALSTSTFGSVQSMVNISGAGSIEAQLHQQSSPQSIQHLAGITAAPRSVPTTPTMLQRVPTPEHDGSSSPPSVPAEIAGVFASTTPVGVALARPPGRAPQTLHQKSAMRGNHGLRPALALPRFPNSVSDAEASLRPFVTRTSALPASSIIPTSGGPGNGMTVLRDVCAELDAVINTVEDQQVVEALNDLRDLLNRTTDR